MSSVTRGTGRPAKYLAADGVRVPSVTQITGRFKDSARLIGWAYNRGRDGLPRFDDAKEVGTTVHEVIEARIFGLPEPDVAEEQVDRVASAISAWDEWREDTKLEIVATEQPIVSEQYRYGGTIDAIARDPRGRLVILDWKSSNGIYEDYLWQLAAYGQLWDETHDEPIRGFRIVRVAKLNGDMHFHFFPELDDALETFLHLRKAFESTKSVKARAA